MKKLLLGKILQLNNHFFEKNYSNIIRYSFVPTNQSKFTSIAFNYRKVCSRKKISIHTINRCHLDPGLVIFFRPNYQKIVKTLT
jgi:hypothetical protein